LCKFQELIIIKQLVYVSKIFWLNDLELSHFKLSFKSLISFDIETKLTIWRIWLLFSLLITISLLIISKTDLSLIFILCIKNYDPSDQILYLIILKISLKISIHIYAKQKNIYKIIKNKTLTYKKKSKAHFLINSFIVKRKKNEKKLQERIP